MNIPPNILDNIEYKKEQFFNIEYNTTESIIVYDIHKQPLQLFIDGLNLLFSKIIDCSNNGMTFDIPINISYGYTSFLQKCDGFKTLLLELKKYNFILTFDTDYCYIPDDVNVVITYSMINSNDEQIISVRGKY